VAAAGMAGAGLRGIGTVFGADIASGSAGGGCLVLREKRASPGVVRKSLIPLEIAQ
jgi:hypothetical protein